MKYIDAEKLIAEIERRRSEAEKTFNHIFEYASSAKEISEWVSREYNNILSYIDSLQQEQPEVDLEKEISTWIPAHIRGGDNEEWKDTKNAVTEWGGIVARHFYELGKNSRKV